MVDTLEWIYITRKKLHRQPGTIQVYSNPLQLFMDFLKSYKIWRDNPVDDLLAMQTLSKVWAGILNKYIRTSQKEKI